MTVIPRRAPEPVGRAVAAVGHLELEILAEVAQVPPHRRRAQPGQVGDLPDGQEVVAGAQHAEHRIVVVSREIGRRTSRLRDVGGDVGVLVTRLAYGLPIGGDLDYADEVTLAKAIEGRRTLG